MTIDANRVKVVKSESERLIQYLQALPSEAWNQPSACTQWQIQDVVAHLAGGAELYVTWLSGGLQGETAPTGEFPPAGVLDSATAAEPIAQGAIAMRETVGERLLATFEVTNHSLNQLLAGLGPNDWETPCYHPWQIIPARQFLALQLQELTLHEWDIRSSLEPEAHLATEGLPAIMELISEASTNGFLRWAFRPHSNLNAAVRYRFELTGTVPSRIDIVIHGDQVSLEESSADPANVTLQCDTATYVLVVYGRLSLEDALATGRLVVEGDQMLAMAFSQSFKGI